MRGKKRLKEFLPSRSLFSELLQKKATDYRTNKSKKTKKAGRKQQKRSKIEESYPPYPCFRFRNRTNASPYSAWFSFINPKTYIGIRQTLKNPTNPIMKYFMKERYPKQRVIANVKHQPIKKNLLTK